MTSAEVNSSTRAGKQPAAITHVNNRLVSDYKKILITISIAGIVALRDDCCIFSA